MMSKKWRTRKWSDSSKDWQGQKTAAVKSR